MTIRVSDIGRAFGGVPAVDGVSFEVRSGELAALLGPSGCGKSTLLRIIAGLETADRGEVWLDGKRVDHLHPRDRQVGFVFQNYALFRHMTVGENVAFGLSVRGEGKSTQRARVVELLERMGLAGLERRLPGELSGGQRQRVALARALAPKPRLLLLDEPFGAVDARVRDELRRWLRQLHDELHTTSIFVTHDQEEAFAIADRVMVIQGGRLDQTGTPVEIMDAPQTEFVARFIGEVNVLDGIVRDGRAWVGRLPMPALPVPVRDGPARVIVRAYDLALRCDEAGIAVVDRVLPLGDRVRVEATLDTGVRVPLLAQIPRHDGALAAIAPGSRISVEVTRARAFPVGP